MFLVTPAIPLPIVLAATALVTGLTIFLRQQALHTGKQAFRLSYYLMIPVTIVALAESAYMIWFMTQGI